MAKWPNAPAVYGWLTLNRRGDWLIKGERIANPMISAFIGRNYERDEHGRWFFQNGPQRVFVALDYAPLVYRVANPEGEPLALECHTGKPVAMASGAWLDEHGALLLETEHGPGIVHDRDLERLFPCLVGTSGDLLEEGALERLMERLQGQRDAPLWLKFGRSCIRIAPIRSAEVPGRFGFVQDPRQPSGEDECR